MLNNKNYYLCKGYEAKAIQKQIIYFHIPKCAGTTLTNILAHLFLWSSKSYIRIKNQNFEKNKKEILEKNYDFVYGHIPYNITNYFPNRYSITILRDPVKRIISHINHEINRGNIPNVGLEECLEKKLIPLNLMTKIFSNRGEMYNNDFQLNDDILNQAIYTLENKIDLVSDTDNTVETLNFLISVFKFPNVLFQWTQQSKMQHVTADNNYDLISFYNSYDLNLYKYAKKNIFKKFNKIPINRDHDNYLLFNDELRINDKKNIFFFKEQLVQIKKEIEKNNRKIIE